MILVFIVTLVIFNFSQCLSNSEKNTIIEVSSRLSNISKTCEQFKTCATCSDYFWNTADSMNCLWCPKTKECVKAGSSSLCGTEYCPCSEYENCKDCILNPSCGWCKSIIGAKCLNGTGMGPLNSTMCAKKTWKHQDNGAECSAFDLFLTQFGLTLVTFVLILMTFFFFCCFLLPITIYIGWRRRKQRQQKKAKEHSSLINGFKSNGEDSHKLEHIEDHGVHEKLLAKYWDSVKQ